MIGVIGGYGDVGEHTVRALHRAGQRLRIGGRDARAAAHAARRVDGAEHAAVDITDPGSVRAFAEGLRALVVCAGPSRFTGTTAADAALAAGADYLDAAGDAPHAQPEGAPFVRAGRTAVLSAGLRPGLTGLFPRAVAGWARADGLTRVHGLSVHTRVVDRFTRTAALEYVHGAAAGAARPLAAWRDGAPRARALTRRTATDLPFFPGRNTLLPQLTAEDERLARDLGLERGDWLTVLSGEHVTAAFDRVHTLPPGEAADLLCRAGLLDLAGRRTSVTLAVTAEGTGPHGPGSRTAVLHGTGNAPLSGAVLARATLAVLRGDIPPGCHQAADVLDPEATVTALTADDGSGAPPPPARVVHLPTDTAPFTAGAATEEGTL